MVYPIGYSLSVSARINIVNSYIDADGNAPFNQWIDSIKDQKTQIIIVNRINRLRGGNLGYCRNLANGIWEMKIDYGPGYRVYFAQAGKAFYLLLGGGDKGTQKSDIKEAKKRWQEYKKRTSK
jgi:putative addiction module killer protein